MTSHSASLVIRFPPGDGLWILVADGEREIAFGYNVLEYRL